MFKFLNLVLALVLASGCGAASDEPLAHDHASSASELKQVTLQLNWYPEAEHGGYYAALVHGYYREAGLDVRIVSGGPDTPVLQQVATGRAMFGVINADNILYGRAEGAPVVALMAPLQTSPRCLIVHRSSGIREFSQLKNMTLAMSTTQAFSFFLRSKVPLTGVTVIPYTGNVARFLVDENFGQQGYVFSEPHLIREQGGDPHTLMLADLGFNPYTSLLFTRERNLVAERKLVTAMANASIRGWKKYLADPKLTNERIQSLNPEMDPGALAYGAKAIVPLTESKQTKTLGFGVMTQDRWQTLIDQMVACKQLAANAVKAHEVFRSEAQPDPAMQSATAEPSDSSP